MAPQQFCSQQMLQNYQLPQNPPITPGNVPSANQYSPNGQYANGQYSNGQYQNVQQMSPNAGQYASSAQVASNSQPFSFQ